MNSVFRCQLEIFLWWKRTWWKWFSRLSSRCYDASKSRNNEGATWLRSVFSIAFLCCDVIIAHTAASKWLSAVVRTPRAPVNNTELHELTAFLFAMSRLWGLVRNIVENKKLKLTSFQFAFLKKKILQAKSTKVNINCSYKYFVIRYSSFVRIKTYYTQLYIIIKHSTFNLQI